MANTDEGTCCAMLIFAGLAAALTMAPYLSLEAIYGNPGAVGTLLALGLLALTAVGPFIPAWGVVLGAQFRWDRQSPADLPTAEIPRSLETIIDRVDDVLRKPPAGDRSRAEEFAGRSDEFRRKEQTLRGLADMVLSAGVRLSLAGAVGPAAPPLDDRGVDDLIRNIRARMEAEDEIERRWD